MSTSPLEIIPTADELQARIRRGPLLDEVSLESRDPFRIGNWVLVSVPEPQTLILFIIGITGLLLQSFHRQESSWRDKKTNFKKL